MHPNGTETCKLQKAVDVMLGNPIRLNKDGAQANLASYLENWLPKLIVVDNHQPRFGCAMLSYTFEGSENVYRVKNVVEQDVVELLAKFEVFGVGLDKVQVRVLLPCARHHRFADLYTDTIRRHDCSK